MKKFTGYSPQTKKFLQSLVQEYQIDDAAGTKLLEIAGRALDRLFQAQDILKREGIMIRDRTGGTKMHPACIVEKDARAHFLQTLKALNLDIEPLKAIGRPGGR